MNIYLLRHGETEHNKRGVYYGKTDSHLNIKGIDEINRAKVILEGINFNKVFISESMRTKQTYEIIFSGKESLKINIDKRINELDFGEFEGKSYDYIKNTYPEECLNWENDWKGFIPPDGESYVQFYKRVKQFMDYIITLKEENVLIITHSGVIKSIYCYVLFENIDLFWKFSSKNGDISIIKYEYGNMFIDSIMHV